MIPRVLTSSTTRIRVERRPNVWIGSSFLLVVVIIVAVINTSVIVVDDDEWGHRVLSCPSVPVSASPVSSELEMGVICRMVPARPFSSSELGRVKNFANKLSRILSDK